MPTFTQSVKRIAKGSNEQMRKVGAKGAPTAKAFKVRSEKRLKRNKYLVNNGYSVILIIGN